MKIFRKALVFVPVGLALALSDQTLAGFVVMLVGGLVFWIPYWLAWWLSDGFATVYIGAPGGGQPRHMNSPALYYNSMEGRVQTYQNAGSFRVL